MAVLRDRTFGSATALRRWAPCTRPRRPFAGPRTSGSVARADRSGCASAGRPARVLGSPPPVVVVLADPSGTHVADDVLCDALCAGLGALVLHVFWGGEALERAAGALDWAADHAAELDGDPRRVLVAGRDRAAVAASALALRATRRRLAAARRAGARDLARERRRPRREASSESLLPRRRSSRRSEDAGSRSACALRAPRSRSSSTLASTRASTPSSRSCPR